MMSHSKLNIIILIILLTHLSVFPKLIDENEKAEDTIYIKSSINEVFARTEVLQYFKNTLDTTIELSVSFPMKKEISLSKFEVTIGDKKVSSKIMQKEIAQEKYEESISQGNVGFISEYSQESDEYKIKIGNVQSGEFVQLQAFFYQRITSQDMSYEFTIMEKYPTFHYNHLNQEKFRNKKIKAIFTIKAHSKITRLIAPFFDDQAKKNSQFETFFNDDYTEAKIYYIKNPDEQTNIDTIGKGLSGQVDKPTFYSTFCILFRTANMNKPTLYYQYNPELKEISYAINYIYSSNKIENIPIPSEPDLDNSIIYSVKYEQNKNYKTPGLFIILVDQSGSMWGKPIELVKKALLSFIEILPKGSYFHLIGFGSHFKKYSEEPVEYNEENVEKYKKIIEDMDGNLGGTNIGEPLQYIFGNEYYDNIKLSKNIFLLTDGQVNNRDLCIDLITKNSNKFRTHAIGIGNHFDKVLVERSGKVGKGSSFFVKDAENIEMVMLNILVKCLRPYLIDINFNFNNNEKILKNKIISSTVTNDFSYNDEIINFSFILDEKNKIFFDDNINIEITAKDPINLIKQKIYFKQNENVFKISNGDEMAKMIVGNALKNNLEFIENEKREIEFSTKYQILSKNTAIFTEISNKNGKIEQNDKKIKLTKVNLNEYKPKDSTCYNCVKRDFNYRHPQDNNKIKIEKTYNIPDIEITGSAGKNPRLATDFSGSNYELPLLESPFTFSYAHREDYRIGGVATSMDYEFIKDNNQKKNKKRSFGDIPNFSKINKKTEFDIKMTQDSKTTEKEKENEKGNNIINNNEKILCFGLNILFYYYLLIILLI